MPNKRGPPGDQTGQTAEHHQTTGPFEMPKIASITLAAVFAAAAFIMPAQAETMTCKNPRREYRVEFDGKNFLAKAEEGTTRYRVTNVVDMPNGRLVIGKTNDGDLNFEADFGDREIRYFMDGAGEALQTDVCGQTRSKSKRKPDAATIARENAEADCDAVTMPSITGNHALFNQCVKSQIQIWRMQQRWANEQR